MIIFLKNHVFKVIEAERLSANPDLIGKTALEIHDKTVEALTEAGLMVILNNHVSQKMFNIYFLKILSF